LITKIPETTSKKSSFDGEILVLILYKNIKKIVCINLSYKKWQKTQLFWVFIKMKKNEKNIFL